MGESRESWPSSAAYIVWGGYFHKMTPPILCLSGYRTIKKNEYQNRNLIKAPRDPSGLPCGSVFIRPGSSREVR